MLKKPGNRSKEHRCQLRLLPKHHHKCRLTCRTDASGGGQSVDTCVAKPRFRRVAIHLYGRREPGFRQPCTICAESMHDCLRSACAFPPAYSLCQGIIPVPDPVDLFEVWNIRKDYNRSSRLNSPPDLLKQAIAKRAPSPNCPAIWTWSPLDP